MVPAMRKRSLLLATLLACGGASPLAAPFDGERAFEDLVDQVEIGPRPAGSPGAAAARGLISTRLRQAGWPVREHRFRARQPNGTEVEFVNLLAELRGERPERIWIGAHYDTKEIPGVRFVGANDGASGVAVLLELARTLGRGPRPFTVELVFFDGEEAFGPTIDATDGLYGSRALARAVAADGRLAGIRTLILVDMVGDRDLNLAIDRNSAPWLLTILRQAAAGLEADPVDPGQILALVDDHTPFREAGLQDVLALIDFQFGGRATPGPHWHSAADDIDSVSAESLNTVGELLVQVIEKVEERLLRDMPDTGAPPRTGR
jgi:hypothetical protein